MSSLLQAHFSGGRPLASPRPRARLVVRANERGPLELPGGAWWLPGLASAAAADEVVYGQQGRWVINRPSLRVGQQGLVVRSTPPKPQRYAQAAPLSAPLVPVPPSPPAGGLTLSVRGIAAGTVVIDTDFEVLAVPEEPPTSAPMGSCVGIVPWGTTAEAEPPVAGSSKHPRRTLVVRFTCNLCHTVTASYVNPHAWHTGSVFCRCSGCTAVHKLKDNLAIFSEMREVFPPRELRATLLSPEVNAILDRLQRRNLN